MSAVKVQILTPLIEGGTLASEWSMPHATADQFDLGVLTITSAADGAVMQTFQPDRWESVTVYDDDGFEQFTFRNDRAWQGHVESEERRRTA